MLTLASALTILIPATPASAAVISTFTGPVCPNGTQTRLATWLGSGIPTSDTSATVGTVATPLTATVSGYPAGTVTVSWAGAAPTSAYGLYTVAGAGLPAQYARPALELRGGSPHTIDVNFPAATSVYFPIFDVDTSETMTIQGFNGATAVGGAVTVRDPAGGATVTTVGTVATINTLFVNYPDSDGRGLVDVTFATPVTRVRIVDTVTNGTNEIGDIWGCQSLDVVKSASMPTLVSVNGGSATFHTDLTFVVGNTQASGGMRVYAPQLTDNLSTVFSGAPAASSITVTSRTATGPSPACTVNSAYTGTGTNTLLASPAAGFLAPGESCTIVIGVDVTYPAQATSFTKNNTATSSAAGVGASLTDTSTNGTTLPTTAKGDTAAVTPMTFPGVPTTLRLVKALSGSRLAAADQFTMSISPGGAAPSGGNVTTSGSGAIVDANTGVVVVSPATAGTVYSFGEAMATGSTSVMSQYGRSVVCTNANGGSATTLPSSGSSTVPFTITPSAYDDITCTLTNAPLMSSLSIVKATTQSNYSTLGQSIPYTFLVTNTGQTTLTAVSVTDPNATGITCPTTTLASGASTTCTGTHTVTQADLDGGSIINTATVTGAPSGGSNIPAVTSNTVTVPAVQSPAITIVKATTTVSYATVSQSIPYTFTVTNTGNVTLTAVTVTDPNATGITCPATTLAPGASTTCTGNHTITQADLDAGAVINTAGVTATPPSGTPLALVPSNTITVPAAQTPTITIVKATTTVSYATVGQSIPYTFTVTNTGNVTLTAVTVTDPNATGITCPATTLAPGASTTCTGTHTVTQTDLDNGAVINTATVTGTPPSGPALTPVPSNTITVPAVQTPAITIVKATTQISYSNVGDVIPYTFDVTNTGNVTLTAITITDPNATGITCPATTLAPGASTTCTGQHTVTQADLDNGSVINTAQVTATDPNSDPITPVNSNTITVPAVQNTGLTIIKATATLAYATLGETIAYTFDVTNTGNVTLTAVTVTDPNATGITCPATTLAPGASTTCTGTHTITQADLDAGSVINTATVTGTPPTGPALAPVNSNTVTVPAAWDATLTIVKATTTLSYATSGDTIPYAFEVTNTGNVTLTAVTVTDPNATGITCPATTLAPGASTTCTGTHTITQADLDAGAVINTAQVTATDPNSDPITPVDSNTITVPAVQNTGLTIIKATTQTSYSNVGDVIPYTFDVTNTGNVTLTAVTVTDPNATGITCPAATLAPGASTTCTGTHTVTQADLDNGAVINTANVTGTPPTGPALAPVPSNTVTVPAAQTPALTIVKATTQISYSNVGDVIPYTFDVTNTGNVTLTNITVADPNATAITCPATSLAPGASTTCTGEHTVTQADLDNGAVINTAQATATDPNSDPITPVDSNTITVPAVQNTGLTIVKATTTTNYSTLGDTIPYTFEVTNTGNVTLTNITVTDPNATAITCPATSLAPGASTTCTGTHTITQADLDAGSVINTAQVAATDPNTDPITPVDSNTITVPAVQNSGLTIVKATTQTSYSNVGDTIPYTFEVTNTGNVTLTAVTVTDPNATGITCPATTLTPGASTTCTGTHTVTQADLDNGSVVNTAIVTGTPPSGTPLAPVDSNTVTVPAVQNPAITIAKATTTPSYSTLGQSIPYTFEVTNTGNVSLTNVTVTDPNATGITCPATTLADGASTTCTGQHTVTQTDLDAGSVINTANVTGTPPTGPALTPVPSNTVTVPAAQTPTLIIVKATTQTDYAAVGDSIPYTFEVTNTGNVTLTAVTVTDPNATGITCPTTTLAPGASTTCTGQHTVTQTDLDNGSVINTATVSGTPPSGTPLAPVPSNTVTVPAIITPSLTIVKATTQTSYAAVGDVIPYTFEVTNTGNVTLTAVTITDPNATGITCLATTLTPSTSTSCTGQHTVTQADLDAGSVVNTAAVGATTPLGVALTPMASNTITVPAAQTPALAITKATTATTYTAVGDTIGYTFDVTNTGNVTMTAITVSDPMVAGVTCAATTLAPGASTTCTGTHVVSQTDLDNGSVINTASVTGTPPGGSPIAPVASNTVTVPATQTPAVTIVKATTKASVSAINEPVNYSFVVTNTGNVTLSGVTLIDANVVGLSCADSTLAPGASTTCTGVHLTTAADLDAGSIVNTASVTASPPSGPTLAPTPSNTVTVPAIQAPNLTISKATATGSYSAVGSIVGYTFNVVNTGNVTLSAISIIDPQLAGFSCTATTLAAGASTLCTGAHTVVQADVDAGSIVNTAAVTGTPPGGAPITPVPSNTVTVPAIQTPLLTITKATSMASFTAVGDSIPYTFTVRNNGNVTLSSVVVTDPQVQGLTCPAGVLAPAGAMACTATHTVTQADLDTGFVVNTATVTGRPPSGTAVTVPSNTVTVPAIVTPSLAIVKSDSGATITKAGDIVQYSVVVTNTGNVTMSAVQVTDPQAPDLACPVASLPPGASTTCNGTHLVTQAEADAGVVHNVAFVTGTPPVGAPLAPIPSNPVDVPIVAAPQATIAKATTQTDYAAVGVVVPYTFVVTNTGNVTLHDVTPIDPQLSAITCVATTLAPTETTTCNGSHTVTQADLDAGSIINTATVVATPPSGPAIAPVSSNTVTVPAVASPSILVVKATTTVSVASAGTSVPYTFAVTNTGNVTLSAITVTDPNATGITCPAGALAPGATAVCTAVHVVTQADVDAGAIINTAAASATQPNGPALAPVPSNTVTVPVAMAPSLEIVKSVGVGGYSAVGESVPYTFAVTNTGNVTMSAISVSDPIADPIVCAASTLAPSATTSCTGSHTVTQADLDAGAIVNTASVVGTPPIGAPIAPVPSNTVTIPAVQSPALTISKSTATASVSTLDEEVTYEFTVTNTGNVTLSNVTVSDPIVAVITCPQTMLVPGSSTVCTGTHRVTQAELDRGSVVNTASATATPPSGPALTPVDSNTVTIPVTQTPSIEIRKASAQSEVHVAGELVTYRFDVTNTGNVTLTDVTVIDPNATGISCAAAMLAPGATTTCTGTHTVTQSDVDSGALVNTATVVATPPNGQPLPAIPSNTVTLPVAPLPSNPVTPTVVADASPIIVRDTTSTTRTVSNTSSTTATTVPARLADPIGPSATAPSVPVAATATATVAPPTTIADQNANVNGNRLSFTGSEALRLAMFALTLLLSGTAILVIARRRHR